MCQHCMCFKSLHVTVVIYAGLLFQAACVMPFLNTYYMFALSKSCDREPSSSDVWKITVSPALVIDMLILLIFYSGFNLKVVYWFSYLSSFSRPLSVLFLVRYGNLDDVSSFKLSPSFLSLITFNYLITEAFGSLHSAMI